MPELPDERRLVRTEEPAAFIRPETVSGRFCSKDDREELLRVRKERRGVLGRLRRTDRSSWRDAP